MIFHGGNFAKFARRRLALTSFTRRKERASLQAAYAQDCCLCAKARADAAKMRAPAHTAFSSVTVSRLRTARTRDSSLHSCSTHVSSQHIGQ